MLKYIQKMRWADMKKEFAKIGVRRARGGDPDRDSRAAARHGAAGIAAGREDQRSGIPPWMGASRRWGSRFDGLERQFGELRERMAHLEGIYLTFCAFLPYPCQGGEVAAIEFLEKRGLIRFPNAVAVDKGGASPTCDAG